MQKFQDEIINKKIEIFKSKAINVEPSDISNFLENIYFKHNKINEENLKKFLDEDNIEDIVQFLMSDALINPKF